VCFFIFKKKRKGGIVVNLVNLTPHEINIITPEGEIKIQPSGVIARVSVTRERVGEITVDGKTIPIYKNKFGQVGKPARSCS